MFDIREYIDDKLEVLKRVPSETTVRCPSCGGKLIIKNDNDKYCKYLCVSYCHKDQIRQSLGALPSNNFKKPIDISNYQINNVDFSFKNIALTTQSISFKLHQHEFFHDKFQENVKSSYYYYDKLHRLYRLDTLISKEKVIFPNYYDKSTKKWQLGVVDSFPWYNFEFVNKSLVYTVVEGEKTAHNATEKGLICVSPPMGFGWSEDYLTKELSKFCSFIGGFLLIPDNDDIGRKKMHLLARICDKLKIPVKYLELDEYQNKGDDLDDLINYGYDIVDLIKNKL